MDFSEKDPCGSKSQFETHVETSISVLFPLRESLMSVECFPRVEQTRVQDSVRGLIFSGFLIFVLCGRTACNSTSAPVYIYA